MTSQPKKSDAKKACNTDIMAPPMEHSSESADPSGACKPLRYVLMDSRQGLVYSPGVWKNLIVDFTLSFLITNPKDLVSFGLEYFNNLRTKKYMMAEEQEEVDTDNLNPVMDPDKYGGKKDAKPGRRTSTEPPPRVRRKSVFAEYAEDYEDDDEWRPAIYPKTDEQRRNCRERMKEVMLFKEIGPDDLNVLVDAMEYREIIPGEKVISQGAPGDYFYVIDSGLYEAFFATNDGGIRGIAKYNNSGTFGELALMYNVPRTCSIKALTRGGLWALDRNTFRRVVVRGAKRKRSQYLSFLQKVPLLKHLTEYEMLNVADCFIRKSFIQGECVIHQGDEADGMYFIEEGKVSLSMIDETGSEIGLQELGVGDYFGELALIEKQPRAATAHALTDVKLAFLSAEAFERLLGSCRALMESRATQYKRGAQRVTLPSSSLYAESERHPRHPQVSILLRKDQRDSNTGLTKGHDAPAVRLKSPEDELLVSDSNRSIAPAELQRRSTAKSRRSTLSKRLSKFYDRKPSLFQMLPEMMKKDKEEEQAVDLNRVLVSASSHVISGDSPSPSPSPPRQ